MKVFVVAADDAHNYREMGPRIANPGRGWVMVRAEKLDADAKTRAMLNGDFYCSTGVFLKTYEKNASAYAVEVDSSKAEQDIAALPSISTTCVENGVEEVRIAFVGPHGTVLETVHGEMGEEPHML